MTIYYQHIGRELWHRDGPRSVGNSDGGLRRFTFEDIRPFLANVDDSEGAVIRDKTIELAPDGFQVWGIPSGAERVLQGMDTGDALLLLEADQFRYAGQVIHRISTPCWDLSRHIWNEQRFPLIILLYGQMIEYPWSSFVQHFGFEAQYHMRGNTMRLADERVTSSLSRTEEAFMAMLLSGVRPQLDDLRTDFRMLIEALETRLRLVRERGQQQTFRRAVLERNGFCCAVCDLPLPVALDAAHVVPKGEKGSDDPRNGLALCVLHHRLFDAGFFAIEPSARTLRPRDGYSLADLRITRPDICHLSGGPHTKALQWRWEHPLPRV